MYSRVDTLDDRQELGGEEGKSGGMSKQRIV